MKTNWKSIIAEILRLIAAILAGGAGSTLIG